MSEVIKTGGVHHVALTVSDVRRSQAFYMELLGFKHLVDFGPGTAEDELQRDVPGTFV